MSCRQVIACDHWSCREGRPHCAIGRHRAPSPGVCLLRCDRHSGPDRTEAAAALTISAAVPFTARVQVRTMARTTTPAEKRGRVRDYLAAELSLLRHGPVSPAVYDERAASCATCPHRQLDPADAIGFCGRCGCGKRTRARLSTRLHMPKAPCPVKRFGDAAGTGQGNLTAELISIAKATIGDVLARRRDT